MRCWLLTFVLSIAAITAPICAQSNHQQSLGGLLENMRNQVHSGHLDVLAFSRAAQPYLDDVSVDLASTVYVAAQNLKDPDPTVRRYTVLVLSLISGKPGMFTLIEPLLPAMNYVLLNDPDETKAFTLATLGVLGPQVPDTSIVAIEKILATRHDSVPLTVGAAEALARTRPTDDVAQAAILKVVNDPQLPIDLRARVVFGAGQPGVGPLLTEGITSLVAQPGVNEQLRNAAIASTENIGPAAIVRVQDVLRLIASDPGETSDARDAASHALQSQKR